MSVAIFASPQLAGRAVKSSSGKMCPCRSVVESRVSETRWRFCCGPGREGRLVPVPAPVSTPMSAPLRASARRKRLRRSALIPALFISFQGEEFEATAHLGRKRGELGQFFRSEIGACGYAALPLARHLHHPGDLSILNPRYAHDFLDRVAAMLLL